MLQDEGSQEGGHAAARKANPAASRFEDPGFRIVRNPCFPQQVKNSFWDPRVLADGHERTQGQDDEWASINEALKR